MSDEDGDELESVLPSLEPSSVLVEFVEHCATKYTTVAVELEASSTYESEPESEPEEVELLDDVWLLTSTNAPRFCVVPLLAVCMAHDEHQANFEGRQ